MPYPRISIVIPAYNEAKVLSHTITEIIDILIRISKPFEVIVIDDGSIDNTWEVLNALSKTHRFLRAIRFARNFGKEAAIYAGLQHVSGEAAIVMDADLQHPPNLIEKMIDAWEQEKAYIVEAIKETRQPENTLKRLGATIFYALFTRLGLNLRQSTDYKLLDRRVIDQYLKFPERNRFFRGLTAWMGFKIKSISFIPESRQASFGLSRWSLMSLFRMARYSLLAFTTIPLRIVTWLGTATLMISVLLSLQTLWNKLNGHAVEGFTTVILIQLFIGSIVMISLGLIGEYLSCVYEEIKGRPIYIVVDSIDRTDRHGASVTMQEFLNRSHS